MLNAQGQVLTWRLTPRLSFTEVENDLIMLEKRLQSQRKVLKEFYIDNCCTWRKKLQKVFGDQLAVYLDIFHAVKRFTEKIPKRHPLRKECLREWRMVFRDPSDQGEKRVSSTPSPDILECNINNFLKHWKNVEYDGKKLLSAAALKEIRNLRVHIEKGCLSGIKPGRGTNRNENLHKDLNKIMSNSKYGVELAYALLTVMFFNHNERMAANSERRMEYPIEHYFNNSPCTPERFGLKFDQDQTTKLCSSIKEKDTFDRLQIATCTYTELLNRILNTPVPIGHVKQKEDFVDDDTTPLEGNAIDCFSADDNEMESMKCVSISILKSILMRAISWFFIHKSIQSISETAHISISQIPFMISTCSDLSNLMYMTEEEKASEEVIDNLLKSWNLVRHRVRRDGNCLLYSVAYSLKMQVEQGNADLRLTLDTLRIDPNSSLSQIAAILRICVAKEWLGDHSEFYQSFMTENQLLIEAEKFLQDGAYAMDIGDLAIAALSNLLQSPLVIFTSIQNQPIYIQPPTHSPMMSSNPIYLAYLHIGPGHYDAVGPSTTQEDAADEVKKRSCTCGRKSSSKGSACSFVLNQYTCRCPCYNAELPCLEICKCKSCTNPFGVKPTQSTKVGQKRKRLPHVSQTVPLRGKKTAKFMKDVGEPLIPGGFSKMEYLVICSIAQSLMAEDLDWVQSETLNSNEVLTIYNHVSELAQTLQLDLALHGREQKDVEKVLQSTSFKCEVFQQKRIRQ